MQWRYQIWRPARPGSNRPLGITPWLWLFATLAGVLVGAGLVAAARKVLVTNTRVTISQPAGMLGATGLHHPRRPLTRSAPSA
jgi:hypothetical protein